MDENALTDFITARLDEDEAAAKDKRYTWPTEFEVALNPARVLREVAARRRIVATYQLASDPRFDDDQWNSGQAAAVWYTLRELATVWSDHPDYREVWRPGPSCAPDVPRQDAASGNSQQGAV